MTMTKQTESAEQLIQRFTKRTMQLQARKQELQSVYDEYVKLERDLTRLEGSMQAIEYVAYGKMPVMVTMINSRIINQLSITI